MDKTCTRGNSANFDDARELGIAAGCSVTSDATSYNLADLIFGTPSQINQGSYTVVNLRQYVHSLYFQDDFHVSPKADGQRRTALGNSRRPCLNATTTIRISIPLRIRWCEPPAAACSTAAWCIPTIRISGLVWVWHTASTRRLSPAPATASVIRSSTAWVALLEGHQRSTGVVRSVEPIDSLRRSRSFDFPDHAEQLYDGDCQSFSVYNPTVRSNVVVRSARHQVAVHPELVPVGAARDLPKDTLVEVSYNGNHSLRLPILGDYNQARSQCLDWATYAHPPATTSGCLGVQARRPIPTYGPITWVDPSWATITTTACRRASEHRFAKWTVLPELIYLGQGDG